MDIFFPNLLLKMSRVIDIEEKHLLSLLLKRCTYCNSVIYCIFIMPDVWGEGSGEKLLCHINWLNGLIDCMSVSLELGY